MMGSPTTLAEIQEFLVVLRGQDDEITREMERRREQLRQRIAAVELTLTLMADGDAPSRQAVAESEVLPPGSPVVDRTPGVAFLSTAASEDARSAEVTSDAQRVAQSAQEAAAADGGPADA